MGLKRVVEAFTYAPTPIARTMLEAEFVTMSIALAKSGRSSQMLRLSICRQKLKMCGLSNHPMFARWDDEKKVSNLYDGLDVV